MSTYNYPLYEVIQPYTTLDLLTPLSDISLSEEYILISKSFQPVTAYKTLQFERFIHKVT